MGDYTTEDIRRRVQDLSKDQEWNHFYDLKGVRTRSQHVDSPGYNINKWERLQSLISVEGKEILDVGCSDGFYSIQCAQSGAKSVLGIEIDEIRIRRANLAKDVLSVENVSFEVRDLYKFSNSDRFDSIMALGMLHRVPDMNMMLQKLSDLTDELVLEYKSYSKNEDCCYDGGGQTKLNKYNSLHQVPTDLYVENRLKALGFNNFTFDKDIESHLLFTRSICIAKRETR